MFGILYVLYDITMNTVGNIYNNYKNKKSKELTKNYKTNTYIDNRGCTRDLDTDEYRNITHQWNSEKQRWEKIILGPGLKVIRNFQEEEDIKNTDSNDWKVRLYPKATQYEWEHHFLDINGEHSQIDGIIYKGKADGKLYVRRKINLCYSRTEIVRINVWFNINDRIVTRLDEEKQEEDVGFLNDVDRERLKKLIPVINKKMQDDRDGVYGFYDKSMYEKYYNNKGGICTLRLYQI